MNNSDQAIDLTAVLATFNRKAKTLACLEALRIAADAVDPGRHLRIKLKAVLLDDGSTDGTADAVRASFPWVEVLESKGGLFWSRGMHRAFARAMEIGADQYLWVNDDTILTADALQRLVGTSLQWVRHHASPNCIVVGQASDPVTGQPTYGGCESRGGLRRFSYKLIVSEQEPVRCQTFNGNCVLIDSKTARHLGNIDAGFEHAMGDTDYGLRARDAGFSIIACPGVIGYCSRNRAAGTYLDESLSLRNRWRLLLGRKGLPIRSWYLFTQRHGGGLWPFYFLWPYLKFFLSSFKKTGRHFLDIGKS